MNILHVTPYSADAWAYGGIPRIAHALSVGLARRGHHVTVCTTDVCDERARLRSGGTRFGAWPPSYGADSVVVRVFPNLSNRLAYDAQLFLPIGLGKYLRRHAREFDIAHLHAWRNAPTAIAARRLRKAGVPYVVAPNGTAAVIERRYLAKHVFDAVFGTRLLAGARRLIAVSRAERRQLLDLGIGHQRIRLLPNPVDLGEFAPAPRRGRLRDTLGHGGGPLVLFLGKLTPRKRVDLLVGAFGRLDRPDARLVIAGNDMGARRSVEAMARALGIDGRTIFTGLLCGRARLEALADADVVVYPSQDEVFGLVPIEALLAGTPVIVADDSGCGEVVGACGGGQVVALGDVDALARAIDRVLACPQPWRAAAAVAAARIRRMYASEKICAQLEDLYAEAIADA